MIYPPQTRRTSMGMVWAKAKLMCPVRKPSDSGPARGSSSVSDVWGTRLSPAAMYSRYHPGGAKGCGCVPQGAPAGLPAGSEGAVGPGARYVPFAKSSSLSGGAVVVLGLNLVALSADAGSAFFSAGSGAWRRVLRGCRGALMNPPLAAKESLHWLADCAVTESGEGRRLENLRFPDPRNERLSNSGGDG